MHNTKKETLTKLCIYAARPADRWGKKKDVLHLCLVKDTKNVHAQNSFIRKKIICMQIYKVMNILIIYFTITSCKVSSVITTD